MQSVPIIGYADNLRVSQGKYIRFAISTTDESFTARMVRLASDEARFETVPSFEQSRFAGSVQPLSPGSSAVMLRAATVWPSDLTIELWLSISLISGSRQGVVTFAEHQGVFLDRDRITLQWNGVSVTAPEATVAGRWYKIRACLPDRGPDGILELEVAPRGEPSWPSAVGNSRGDDEVDPANFRLSGWTTAKGVQGCLDAKLSGVKISSRSLGPIAGWAFAENPSDQVVRDRAGLGNPLLLLQHPRRLVTGPAWNGSQDPSLAPAQYDAIAFHTDDLTDAEWDYNVSWKVPPNLASGAYALEVRSDRGADHIPFFVTPAGGPQAHVAFVAPTFSYLAYANERHWWSMPDVEERTGTAPEHAVSAAERWIASLGLLSCYDRHRDNTGCTHSSWLRPIANLRAGYHHPYIRGPHQLGCDLMLLDWLHQSGIQVDILTDHDIHEQGVDALAPYAAVLTGSHPEYVSGQILDALSSFRSRGGNLVYLGGNGFHHVATTFPSSPHVIEIRRGHSDGAHWRSPVGEAHHAATGEFGGQWKLRGRSPHVLFGVGTAGVCFDRGSAYRRNSASYESEYAWIFEGVEGDLIDTESVVLGSPAGFEYDRADTRQGTDERAVRVATAYFENSVAEYAVGETHWFGAPAENRSDLAYVPGRYREGDVFSVGSIAWVGCLLTSGPNAVATITANVIRHFTQKHEAT
jgi:N,N-dimethylformamidase